jgi:cohesin complex subunit SCC1
MAFSNAKTFKEVVVDLDTSKIDNLNVANFGEVTEAYLLQDTQPFAIPFDLHALQTQPPEEWAIANDDSQEGYYKGMDLDESQLTNLPQQPRRDEEDEQWTAFDPDDEEDRHVFTDDSKVSDVELVRGANDSLTTEGNARLSFLEDSRDKIITPRPSEQDFPMPDDEDEHIPFDEDSREDRRRSVNLDIDDSMDAAHKRDSIGGLSPEASPKKSRKRKGPGPRRMRKRRKIVIDNDNTQLSAERIKSMLDDTSAIVLQGRIHPADWVEGENDDQPRSFDLRKHLSWERLLVRPGIADDGTLAPELLNLWLKNTAEARGEPKQFLLRGEAGLQQKAKNDVEQVEIARGTQEEELASIPEEEEEVAPMEEDENFPPPDDDDVPHPFDEDDARPSLEEAQQLEAAMSPGFELEWVNDFEEDLQEERQEAGGNLVSSSSKWHKHTVKVLSLLKNRMGRDDDEDTEGQISYNDISKGCSRRTAASVFFELLQLKTWDFIELDQEESYGDIMVSLHFLSVVCFPSEAMLT